MPSVPRKCQPPSVSGAWLRHRSARWISSLECGVMTGTSAPTTKTTTSTIPAARPAGWRVSRRSSRAEAPGRRASAATGTGCASALAISVVPHPWVEPPQGDLAEHRERQHQRAAEQQGDLDRVGVDRDEGVDVELEGVDEERSDPAELEDEVDGECCAEDRAEVRHERGHERDERVPYAVAEHERALGEAFGACDGDVRLVEDVHECVAQVAGLQADEAERESERRHDQMVEHEADVV